MTGRLRDWKEIDPFQHAASDYLYEHNEALALLDTGAGKTMIAMTAGQELLEQGHVKRPLVLAPLRVAQINWPQERFEWQHLRHVEMVEWGGEPASWKPSLWQRSRILHGQRTHAEQRIPTTDDVRKRRVLEQRVKDIAAEERSVNKTIRATEPPACWHVTSFENIAWLTDLYPPGESPFDLWIVDETGRVARNPKSPRYKALKKHMPLASIRWGLNATPAPEGMEDLFGQVQLVSGDKLWGKSFYAWRQKYFAPADYMAYSWRLQIGAFDLLMGDLNTLAFKVPAEALSYKKTIEHRQIVVELPSKARAAYADMEKRMAVELENGVDLVAMSEATASSKLRQITQGYLYETDERGRRVVHQMHDEKTQALAELIDSMGREPLLVAYEYDEDLENLRRIWKDVPYLGQGVSAAVAADNITRWNKRELPVLALHPNCLHPNTLILTEHRGWTRIVEVRADERVFDGVEFVSHSGCQLSGTSPVLERFGIVMTPDHLILINGKWVAAKDVRDTGNFASAARHTYAGNDPRVRAMLQLRGGTNSASSERKPQQSNAPRALPIVPVDVASQNDGHPPVQNMARDGAAYTSAIKPELQRLRWAWDHARPRLAKIQEFLVRHGAQLRTRINDRADRRERAVLQRELLLDYGYGAAGQQANHTHGSVPRTAVAPVRILPGGGRHTRRDKLLSGPLRFWRRSDETVSEIELPKMAGKSGRIQDAQEVYDLVDCGPRHRFAVQNAEGDVFIVHNSASHGLNLQYGGHHICWLALPWGLDPYKQTNERIDRRGQEHRCYGHHIIASDSMDQRVSDALLRKNVDQAAVIKAIRSV